MFGTETGMKGHAVISDDQRYRYLLSRAWDKGACWSHNPKPYIAWVMLNPSTADANVDDPTIRRCVAFSKSWGFDTMQVVNLFALRSPDPKVLRQVPYDEAVGPENDVHLKAAVDGAALTICAWGTDKVAMHRSYEVRQLLKPYYPMCLELAKNGQPKHPLYLPKTLRPRLLP